MAFGRFLFRPCTSSRWCWGLRQSREREPPDKFWPSASGGFSLPRTFPIQWMDKELIGEGDCSRGGGRVTVPVEEHHVPGASSRA